MYSLWGGKGRMKIFGARVPDNLNLGILWLCFLGLEVPATRNMLAVPGAAVSELGSASAGAVP